ETPLNPYRIIWELMHTIDPAQAIITHDSGSPRDQLAPFYQSTVPRGYIGWGKSHGLGTGLGLIMGAKLASPEKIAINIMGDAAFGMVGLDFETAVRNKIPIITMVFNNFGLAVNTEGMPISHERYRSRDTIGNYAEMGRAMGGYTERVESPAEIVPAIRRAVEVTREEERPVLLEFITRQEISYPLIQAL
ncbi:MAG: thiamine pyrophosphate-dependent enzyme, partial [Dehalococcoidales bacterium]